jgi:hypothetical protein
MTEETKMSRRLWTGLLVGVIAALALVAVGVGAFHAGETHSVVTTVAPVAGAPGETVRVVGYGHWGPWGGPPFGFLFPLLFIGLIIVLLAGRRRAYWGRPGGPGACAPDRWGPAGFADWHQQAHSEQEESTAGKDG